jgi:hypothetical protein
VLNEPHIFPATQPHGYTWLADEPAFTPDIDLSLETPPGSVSLADLGYSAAFRANYGSGLAITAPFRLLSPEGVVRLRSVVDQLRSYARHNPDTKRVPVVLRGTAFRSRYIRDLSLSPTVIEFLSQLGGMHLVPTAYSHQLGHTNFPPDDLTQPNVGWHHDENAFVLVVMLHNPRAVDGGEFQYFAGTRHEGAAVLARDGDLPADRLTTPAFPDAGYAILMQGSAILHRAAPLHSPADRITLVTSYDTADVRYPDPNRFYFVTGGFGDVDPNARLERACRYVEYARHKAWRLRGHLDNFINEVPWTEDRNHVLAMFREALAEGLEAIEVLQRGDVTREEAKRLRQADDARVQR